MSVCVSTSLGLPRSYDLQLTSTASYSCVPPGLCVKTAFFISPRQLFSWSRHKSGKWPSATDESNISQHSLIFHRREFVWLLFNGGDHFTLVFYNPAKDFKWTCTVMLNWWRLATEHVEVKWISLKIMCKELEGVQLPVVCSSFLTLNGNIKHPGRNSAALQPSDCGCNEGVSPLWWDTTAPDRPSNNSKPSNPSNKGKA